MTDVIKMPEIFLNNFVSIIEDDEERMEFLPWLMKGNVFHGLTFENLVYQMSEKLTSDYNGGYWDFTKTKKNDVGLMLYGANKALTVANQGNYTEATVDGRIFGVIVSMMVASHASFAFYESKPDLAEKMANLYHGLRDAFYATVDALAYPDEEIDYRLDVKATDEEIEQIKRMSSTVWSLLD